MSLPQQPFETMYSFIFRLFISLFVTISFSSWAQEALTPQQAYEYLRNERDRAQALRKAESASADSLQKAIDILQEALHFYLQPEIKTMAQGYDFLFYQEGEVIFELSRIQLLMGQRMKALESLKKVLQRPYSQVYASFIQEDTIFSSIRYDSSLVSALKKSEVMYRLFDSDAFKTTYAPDISETEKIAGLSKLWMEAKYNFAYFDQVPDTDWDQLYIEYIPKVCATSNTVEYYQVIQQFCAQLHDGHTSIWPADKALADLVYRRPALLTKLVEDKVLIDEVFSDSLLQLGIRPGVEVVRIDGLPVHEYAGQYVRAYQNGSTPQDIAVHTYTHSLLRGPKDQPVEIEFKGTKELFTHRLPRSEYSDYRHTPEFRFQVLQGNIAYVELNTFGNDVAWKQFEATFDSIADTDALILDVRRNDGGNSSYGWNILGCLTDSAFHTGSYAWRGYNPMRRANGPGQRYETIAQSSWPAQEGENYTKPVVVLTSARTFSAGEDFVAAFDAMKRGKLIGETTAGSTGNSLAFDLPGGIMARVCFKRDAYPDGEEWVGIGLQPDIVVQPKATDLQAGRDTVLEAALKYLRNL